MAVTQVTLSCLDPLLVVIDLWMLHYSLVDQLNWLTLILLPVDVLHTAEDALPRDEVLELCDDLVVDAAVVDDRAQLLDDVDIVVLLDLGL